MIGEVEVGQVVNLRRVVNPPIDKACRTAPEAG